MDFADIAGKSVLITGASGGLGLHFAEMLAVRGANVTLAARRAGPLKAACEAIVQAGGTARAVALDVTDPASVAAAVPDDIDIVVNNAGISRAGPALQMDEADWHAVIDTNLSGVFRVAQAAGRAMQAHGRGGAIVNIASILGLRVAGGVAAYAASKAAVVHLTQALALEWARHGIRVNALCPGYVETDINRDYLASDAGLAQMRRIPMRRIGRPEDLDGALLLLASDAGRYMTGVALPVDGGHLISTL